MWYVLSPATLFFDSTALVEQLQLARQYRDTTRGVSGVSDGWSRVVDALAKLAGTKHILSVMSSAAFKKMSAAEVYEILDHVKDDTVVLDLNDETLLKVVDGKIVSTFDSSDDSSTAIEPFRMWLAIKSDMSAGDAFDEKEEQWLFLCAKIPTLTRCTKASLRFSNGHDVAVSLKRAHPLASDYGGKYDLRPHVVASKVDVKNFTITLTSAVSKASRGDVTFYAVLNWVKSRRHRISPEDPCAVLKILCALRDDILHDPTATDEERLAVGKMMRTAFNFVKSTAYFLCGSVGWEFLEFSVIKDIVRSDELNTQAKRGTNELKVLELVLLWLRCVKHHELI